MENRCQPSPIWLSSFSLKDDYACTMKEYCDRQIPCREKTNVNKGCAFSLEFHLEMPDDPTISSDSFTLILIHLLKFSVISGRPQLFDLRDPESSSLLVLIISHSLTHSLTRFLE